MQDCTKTHRILRFILLLSGSYPRTKDECTNFLEIKDSAFYNYCKLLKDSDFNLVQKEGKYRIEFTEDNSHILSRLLHFSEEECCLLSNVIDDLDENMGGANNLKKKLVSFLNQDNAIEAYIQKEKTAIVQAIRKAQKAKKQILLIDYSSGNSQTVRNRMVEPFEFKDDFSMVWAFDTGLKQNRQFKVCRIGDVLESPLAWEHAHAHRSLPVDLFRNTGELDKQVEFRLNLRARNLLTKEYPLSTRHINLIGSNQYFFKASVAKYEGPGRFVLGIMEDIESVGDEGFRNFLKEKLNNFKSFFENSTISGVL